MANPRHQLSHAEFTSALLGAVWHASWISNLGGLDLLTEVLPILAASDPDTADAAAAISSQFANAYTLEQQHELDQFTGNQPSRLATLLGNVPLGRRRQADRQALITREGLDMNRPGSASDQPLLGQPGDRNTAILILRAGLQAADRQDGDAVASLQAAAHTGSTRLGQAVGARALAIAGRLVFAGRERVSVPTEIGLAAAKIATEMLPDSAAAWSCYGPALYEVGRNIEALAACDRALTLAPNSASIHNTRGNALWALGRLEEALAAYDQALTSDADRSIAYNGRGIALRALGRLEEALAAYDQALALDPNFAFAHNNRGNVLRLLGRPEEALAAYNQALALDPDYAMAYVNSGIILADIGDLGAALGQFEVADRLDPARSGEARTWAGAIFWHRRDAAAARDQFAYVGGRVYGCSPFRTAEMETIALCGLGQPRKAEQHLLSAVPRRAAGDRVRSQTIYDLLADPPLPGIDRLRAIVANDGTCQ